ncbi:MAG: DUF3078 domain-containing protein [Bacteroidota bacterium]
MKSTLLTCILATATINIFAQDTLPKPPSPWKREMQAGVNINQATYSDNWKSGGVNSIAIGTFLNAKADYRTEKYDWTNDLQLLYGNIQNKGQNMRKNADRIFLESKFAYRLTKNWSAFGSATFMSQFDAGYEYYRLKDSTGKEYGEELSNRISSFMSPGYLTEAIGIEYKPVEYFSAQFGLGALRQTFVTDQTLYDKYAPTEDKYNELYGVKRGEYMRNQVVFQFVANFDKEVLKNIFVKARYMAVIDYAKINGQGIVHRLDANLTAKVNRFVNVNLAGVILYDYDQDQDVQFSQVLSLGILYGISNEPKK